MEHKKTFYLTGGTVFSNLERFAKELQTMTDDVFKHHVNKDKHDFKEWIHHSLKEEKLANQLEDKIDKLEIELEVLRYLVHEDKPKKKKTTLKKKESTQKVKPKKVESKAKSTVKKTVTKSTSKSSTKSSKTKVKK